MLTAKKHIAAIVGNYIRMYPKEFEMAKEGIRMQKGLYLDEFASAKLEGAPDMRALYEIPVTLHEMLVMGLDEEEMVWFKAGGRDRKAGGKWFAKTFKYFALPRSI